ncbi:MAG: response regulator [candidate division Zixibacteria bacterium]|nr:response regulator [candidate division Zixibacteria bacterium]
MKHTILVVDDEKEICNLFQDTLVQEGYQVLTATNGKEAVSLGKQNRFDLALLDIKMPGMDGIEVFQKLKKVKKDMQVIILTGYGTLKTAKEAMKLGAYDFLTKPFDLGLVKNIIHQALERKKEG